MKKNVLVLVPLVLLMTLRVSRGNELPNPHSAHEWRQVLRKFDTVLVELALVGRSGNTNILLGAFSPRLFAAQIAKLQILPTKPPRSIVKYQDDKTERLIYLTFRRRDSGSSQVGSVSVNFNLTEPLGFVWLHTEDRSNAGLTENLSPATVRLFQKRVLSYPKISRKLLRSK